MWRFTASTCHRRKPPQAGGLGKVPVSNEMGRHEEDGSAVRDARRHDPPPEAKTRGDDALVQCEEKHR